MSYRKDRTTLDQKRCFAKDDSIPEKVISQILLDADYKPWHRVSLHLDSCDYAITLHSHHTPARTGYSQVALSKTVHPRTQPRTHLYGAIWFWLVARILLSLIARFMGPTWGPSGDDRTQGGSMLAPSTLLSGVFLEMLLSCTKPSRYSIIILNCQHSHTK